MTKVRIKEADVKAAFASAKCQADYLIAIYKLVFPEWDEIEQIGGWPCVNDFTWKAICRMAMDWDVRHVDSMSGGAWMNKGFSGHPERGVHLENWEVSMDGVIVQLKKVASNEAKEVASGVES